MLFSLPVEHAHDDDEDDDDGDAVVDVLQWSQSATLLHSTSTNGSKTRNSSASIPVMRCGRKRRGPLDKMSFRTGVWRIRGKKKSSGKKWRMLACLLASRILGQWR